MTIFNILPAASLAAILTAGAAGAQTPRMADEGDYVSVSGTIVSVDDDSFHIDYGMDTIEVETDPFYADYDVEDRFAVGEQVTVYGYADDDFLEGRVIEAASVFASERSTFYGDPALDTMIYYADPYDAVVAGDTVVALEGTVEAVSGREFTLDVAGLPVSVETVGLGYNPLDDIGFQQIDVGDEVVVTGEVENRLFDEAELRASAITSIDS